MKSNVKQGEGLGPVVVGPGREAAERIPVGPRPHQDMVGQYQLVDTRLFCGHGDVDERTHIAAEQPLHPEDVDCDTGHPSTERPPSTNSVWPVMYPAAGLARNSTAGATSAGVPKRPMGVRARIGP